MSDSISLEQLNNIRKEFKAYLREANPGWSESSVSTVSSDAFFVLNNNVGVDFWANLVSEDSLLAARDAIGGIGRIDSDG